MTKFVKTALISLLLLVFFAGPGNVYPAIIGDLDGNYLIDFRDVRILAQEWLDPICLISGCEAELDNVDGVAMGDLAVLANNWQMEEAFVVISEFMAANINTLLDGDNQSSDWIEIYNPTDTILSLDGWYLTDNDANLTKWQFPSGVEIEPGKFLLVFASNKDQENYPFNYPYLDPAGRYHTNFEINQQGDYLALVAPDGTTIVHEYESPFPDQLTDVSYGLAQHAITLVPTGATASYHVPTIADSSADWTNPSFDDSLWDTGPTSIGFGVAGTLTQNLVAQYEFEGDAGDSSGNGHHGTEQGDPGYVTGVIGQAIDLDGLGDYVSTGKSASDLGIDGSNAKSVSAWVYTRAFNNGGIWDLGARAEGQNFCLRTMTLDNNWRVQYWGGAYDHDFTYDSLNKWVHFTLVYTGTQSTAYADAVPVSTADRTLNTSNANPFQIGRYGWPGSDFDGIIDDFRVYDRVLSDEEIEMVMSGSLIRTDIQAQMQNVNASLWTRIEFEVEDPQHYDMMTLQMKYEDGFVAYLNGQKVAEANAPYPVYWNSTALSDRPIEEASVFKNFNITANLGLLLPKPQKNVLAIQGLNDHKNDGEFLILPELLIAKNQMVPQYFTTPTPEAFNISPGGMVQSFAWIL
ncbi:MAG: LamG-like jellyroll fold domain-containing protein [Planctomycetota bacterium]|jgi:hypothetical protein